MANMILNRFATVASVTRRCSSLINERHHRLTEFGRCASSLSLNIKRPLGPGPTFHLHHAATRRPTKLDNLQDVDKLCRHLFCSEAASVDEDDVSVYYDGLVKRLASRSIQLFDVREASELAEFGQIASSVHIPLGEVGEAFRLPDDKFEAKYGQCKPSEDAGDIVFHCKSGVRSLKAVGIAKELGYTNARHFPGGWLQWAEKNNLPSA